MINFKLMLAAAGMIGFAATQSMAAMSKEDQDFARKAASGGLAEVAMGQLAQQNGGSADVKAFGQRMVTDHSQANQSLQEIARQANLTLPKEPDSKEMAAQKRLSGLKGAAFDAAYAKDMLQDHQHDVADFEKQAQSGQDPALKEFARKTLPTLREHLKMTQSLAAK